MHNFTFTLKSFSIADDMLISCMIILPSQTACFCFYLACNKLVRTYHLSISVFSTHSKSGVCVCV